MNTPSRTPAVVRWSLCLVTFATALEYPDRFPVEVTTLAAAVFLGSTLCYPRLVYDRVAWPALYFAGWLMVQLVAAVVVGARYPGGFSTQEVSHFFELELVWVLFFGVAVNLLNDPRVSRSSLRALAAGCLVRAVLPMAGFARSTHIEGTGEVRLTVMGQNPNQSAHVLAIGLLIIVGTTLFGRRDRTIPPIAGWSAAGLIAVGLIQTGSRGGLAALAAGLLVLIAGGRSWRGRVRSLVIVSLAMVAIASLAWRSDVMRTRILKAAEGGDFAQREHIFPTLIQMVEARPLLGWGPTTNKYELASRLGDARYDRRDPHNAYLEVLTSSGVLGMIPFLLGIGWCVWGAWLARAGPFGLLPLSLVSAVLVGNLSGNRLAGPVLWFALAYAYGTSPLGRWPRTSSKLRPPRSIGSDQASLSRESGTTLTWTPRVPRTNA